MPLYDDLEVRRQPVRLEAEPGVDYWDLALQAAQAGALGGAVGLGAVRGLGAQAPRTPLDTSSALPSPALGPRVPAYSELPHELRAALTRELSNQVALNRQRLRNTARAPVDPARARWESTDLPMEGPPPGHPSASYGSKSWPIDEFRHIPYSVQVTRSAPPPVDAVIGPRPGGERILPRGGASGIEGLSMLDLQGPYAAEMQALGGPYSGEESTWPKYVERERVPPYLLEDWEGGSVRRPRSWARKNHFDGERALSRAGAEDSPEVWRAVRESARDRWNRASMADRLAGAPANEPFAPTPSRLSRVGSVLKSGIKGALNPASILADAVVGSLAGAGSALAGYESSRPRSAGLFTPPGEGYEGIASPELIERIANEKELEREAERQRLLEQYRASGYDLDPNTRLRDLR